MRYFATSLWVVLVVPFFAYGQATSAAERAVLEAQLKVVLPEVYFYDKEIIPVKIDYRLGPPFAGKS